MNSNEFMAYKIKKILPYYRVLFRIFWPIISVILRISPRFFFFKSKINLLSAKKAEKIADNKAQFELTIAYFHVFQGKNKNNKITLIIGPKPPTPTLFWDKKRYFGGRFPLLKSGGWVLLCWGVLLWNRGGRLHTRTTLYLFNLWFVPVIWYDTWRDWSKF